MSDVQSIYIPLTFRSNRQTVLFLLVDPMDKEHKDPDTIDLEAPRLAWYKQKVWKKHQNAVYWVDIKLAQKEGLKFFQTRSNAIILHETLPAYCFPKVVRVETGEFMYEKVYASLRPPPNIFFQDMIGWKNLDSEVAGQPEGEVARQAKGSQPTQPNPNPNQDRTARPIVCSEGASRSQEIETRSFRDSKNFNSEEVNPDRTGGPVVCLQRASQTRFSRESKNLILEETNHDRTERPVVCSQSERSMVNEVDIDFRISGLAHSVVKQAENYRVRQLIKQIENHPHRQALQHDLQQNNANNPFSEVQKDD